MGRGKLRLSVGLLLAGSLSLGLMFMGVPQAAAIPVTLVVDDDGFASAADCNDLTPAFVTISAAEAVANPDDTIKVCPGTYNEMVFIDVDNLTLLGAQAGVDARTRATLPTAESVIDHPCGPVQIASDDVVFDGFTAQGANLPPNIFFACFGAGIWTNPGFLGNQGGHQILNNIVQDNIIGISLANTCGNLLRFNLIRNNDEPGPAGGNGIYSDTPICDTDIDQNKFSGQTSGSVLIFGPGANLNLTNNELVGGTPERFSLGSVNTGTVSGNVSIGSTGVSGTVQLFGGDSNITIEHNTLRNGVRGIRVRDLGAGPNTNVDAHFNCIEDNSIAGLHVDSGGHSGTLHAENNWWGDPSGPTHPSNPGGTGDAIIDADGVVDFTPWLLSPTGTGPFCPPPPPPPPPPAFKSTGGGQINVTGGRGSFGFNAKQMNGDASGHLTYTNHATGAHLNCTVEAAFVTSNTAEFSGTCSANSSAGSFEAEVEDVAEPGKNADHFKITYNATTEGNTIRAGNVQVHQVP